MILRIANNIQRMAVSCSVNEAVGSSKINNRTCLFSAFAISTSMLLVKA